MSQSSPFGTCPKCGYASQNPEVCDACGALLSKIRGREYMNPSTGESDDFYDNSPPTTPVPQTDPFDYDPPKPWLTYAALALVAAGAVAGYIFIKDRGEAKEGASTQAATAVTVPPTEPVAADTPEPIRATPASTPTPSRPVETPLPVVVPQHPPTGGKVAEDAKPVLSWLDSLKSGAAQAAAETPASQATPTAPTTATPSAATARRSPTPAASSKGIEIGEDMFSNSGTAPSSRAAEVLEKLQSRTAQTATPTPNANVAGNVTQVTDETFLSEIAMYADTPVLVGFVHSADPSAGQVMKVLGAMQQSFSDQLKVAVVDVASAKSTAARFNATGGVTMLFIKRGREQARAANPLSQADVQTFVAAQLGSN